MRVLSARYLLLAIVVVLLLDPNSGFGQGGGGSIDGLVLDQIGSIIPGAQVTLTREGTGDIRRIPTNYDGFFSFVALPVGSYTLEVEFEGFSKFTQKGIAVHPGDKLSLRNIARKPGGLNEVLNVTDSADNVIPVDTGRLLGLLPSKFKTSPSSAS